MRCFSYILLTAFLFSPIFGEEKKLMPWLGAVIHHPESFAERPVEMGFGTGLMVHHVSSEGPFAKSGYQKGDLLWKLNDQILVNRGQLVALLKLHVPGDEVVFKFFRGGKLSASTVSLGKRPKHLYNKESKKRRDSKSLAKKCEVEEVAEMTSVGVHYCLKDCKNGLHARISKDGEVLFEGPIAGTGSSSEFKPQWNGALLILRQALASRKEGPKRSLRLREMPQKPQKSN